MLILLTIFLYIFIPLIMLILHLIRPRLNIQGFLVILATLTGLPMVFLARSEAPEVITFLRWNSLTIFPVTPTLLIDNVSWYFAVALIAFSFSVVITSIAQLGMTTKPVVQSIQTQIQVIEGANPTDEIITPKNSFQASKTISNYNWLSWVAILVLTSIGLVAVTAGNLLTLLLAWAAMDFIELIIFINQSLPRKSQERIVMAFFVKIAGIAALLIVGLRLWSTGNDLYFEDITQSVSALLIIAAILRLGVLPLGFSLSQERQNRSGYETILLFVPIVSCFILLVRVSNVGVKGMLALYMLGLTAIMGLLASIYWIRAKNELDGQPYWILTTASLAISAAILGLPLVCLAWSIASILSGGLIFSLSIRHKNLTPLVLLGIFNLSALPFSPTWQATSIYQSSSNPQSNPVLFALFSFLFLMIHAFLLVGFARYLLRGIFSKEEMSTHVERWVWFLYPVGLIIITITHLVLGWYLSPRIHEVPILGWIMGSVILFLAGFILIITRHSYKTSQSPRQLIKTSTGKSFFSLNWIFLVSRRFFRTISRLFAILSSILEGDGGILWALVLFALLFVFLHK